MNVLTKAAVQGTACGLVIGLVLLIGRRVWHPATVAAQGSDAPDRVRARSFEVLDAGGKIRANLALMPDEEPFLRLADATGKTRALLALMPDGEPVLRLADATGKTRALLTLMPDGGPVLGLADAAGSPRAELSLRPYGSPRLGLWDAAGKVVWKAP